MLHKIFGRECDAFYPPTRAILEGAYCEHSLQGTRWGASAGARDPHPDHAGIAGMKRAPAWLREQGATVVTSIEDLDYSHGALVLVNCSLHSRLIPQAALMTAEEISA